MSNQEDDDRIDVGPTEIKWRMLANSNENSLKRKDLALQIQQLRQRVDRLNDKMDAFLVCVRRRGAKSPSSSPLPSIDLNNLQLDSSSSSR